MLSQLLYYYIVSRYNINFFIFTEQHIKKIKIDMLRSLRSHKV